MAAEQVKILVADDEEVVRDLLQRTLTEAGYDVTTAADGVEALSAVSQGEVEVVLLDIKMPGMSGIEVLGKLTTDWPDICVIIVTAVVDTQTAIEALKMSAYDYITKPFNRDNVVRKVQEAIERWNYQLQDRRRHLQLKESITDQTQRMQEQFMELLNSLTREQKLLHKLVTIQAKDSKSLLSELPPELQEPVSSVEEFRDALLRILRRT
jgi:putative two-component system response regulator